MALLLLFISLCIPCCLVDAGINNHLDKQQSVGDEFDCVDIYKQPAFQHPLLKNHKIQLKPTFGTNAKGRRSGKALNLKDRNLNRKCPAGKVPIHKKSLRHEMKSHIQDFDKKTQEFPHHHIVRLDTTQNMTFYGASASISMYSLWLEANQTSLSTIWLQSGPPAELNSIQVGFGVYPSYFGDNNLRITSYWTADGFKNTGCLNFGCPGFMQINGDVFMGSSIGLDGKSSMPFKVQKDDSVDWWLMMGDTQIQVGYWPKEIFTHLQEGASSIRYGGEAYAPPIMPSPPMGSGKLPEEHFKNAAYFSKLKIVDTQYNEVDVKRDDMKISILTSPTCYDLLYQGYQGPEFRQAFLFGGPGGQCGI